MTATMPPPSPIARRILRAISDREMTPAQFARRVSIHESYFSRLKGGSIVEPSPTQLRKIADGLGTTVEALIEGAPLPAGSDAAFVGRLRTALGDEKAHLFEATFEALRELPPNERDRALEVIHVVATNWPRKPR